MHRFSRSISQRLLWGLIVVSVVYTLAIAWFTVADSVDEVYELFDAHLAQTGLALLRVADPDEGDTAGMPAIANMPALRVVFDQWPELPQRLAQMRSGSARATAPSIESMHLQYERSLRYQVWGRDGVLILRSANAPSAPMTLQEGLSESPGQNGSTWKFFAVWDRHHDFRIVVSEDYGLRNRLVRSIALHVASPLGLGLPVLILLVWLSIRRSLAPLDRLVMDVESRKPDNLDLIDNSQTPHEVKPMVQALNHLLQRMALSIEGERRFTANAAHELRTPLAAIQAQVYLVKSAHDEQERHNAVTQLQRGVERAIRLVGQMLTLARLDPQTALADTQAVNLSEVAKSVCAELAPLALQRGQTLELHADTAMDTIPGNADMVSMLISNLVDNAIRYTPGDGLIHVEVCGTEQAVCVQVHDNGPGIPAEQRERIFERFYRVAHSDQTGTGLGLAICRRIAELHNANVYVQPGPDGLGTSAVACFSIQPIKNPQHE
jgi:two-component system sensor histidine kinase QseC